MVRFIRGRVNALGKRPPLAGFALASATLSLKLWWLGFDITIVAGIG
jgi:hypothetical protein